MKRIFLIFFLLVVSKFLFSQKVHECYNDSVSVDWNDIRIVYDEYIIKENTNRKIVLVDFKNIDSLNIVTIVESN